jgi:threonine/homoserine/homoserine lactone efflux protein
VSLSILFSAFALGLVLASAPGPVQAVLLAESARGGRRRGFAAMLGANATFAVLLMALAGGLALVAPTGTAARLIRLGGGVFLLLLAADTWRSARRPQTDAEAVAARRGLPPTPRGVLAVILNPGAWIFLGTTAAALMADAIRQGGRGFAFLTAAAMTAGIVVIDGTFVLLASESSSRLGALGSARLAYVLGAALAVFGLIFIVSAAIG